MVIEHKCLDEVPFFAVSADLVVGKRLSWNIVMMKDPQPLMLGVCHKIFVK